MVRDEVLIRRVLDAASDMLPSYNGITMAHVDGEYYYIWRKRGSPDEFNVSTEYPKYLHFSEDNWR